MLPLPAHDVPLDGLTDPSGCRPEPFADSVIRFGAEPLPPEPVVPRSLPVRALVPIPVWPVEPPPPLPGES